MTRGFVASFLVVSSVALLEACASHSSPSPNPTVADAGIAKAEPAGEADATSTPRPTTVALSIRDLRHHVQRAKSYRPKDQFDTGPDTSSLVGKPFEIEIAARPDRTSNCPGQPTWWFRAAESTLYVAWSSPALYYYYLSRKSLASLQDEAASYNMGFVSFDCAISFGTPYRAANAFGVSRLVTVEGEAFTALAYDISNRACLTLCTLWKERLEPDRARTLSNSLRVRIRGQIGQWKSGNAIVCAARSSSPTLSAPVERHSRGCFIRIQLDEASLVDSKTGKMLARLRP